MGFGHRTRYNDVTAKRPGKGFRDNRLWLGPAVACLAATLVVARRTPRMVVHGASMEPTLEDGDRVVLWRTRRLKPGDIVAAPDPRDSTRQLLKRVVALSGEDLWLEGDNASASTDSRHFGPVQRGTALGRAVYRYHPPHRVGPLARRLGASAQLERPTR